MTLDRTLMPEAAPEPGFTPPTPSRTTLANGLSVLVVERPDLPMVAFGLVMRTGSASDPANQPGLTNMAVTMLQEGTSSRSSQQISDEMERMGSDIHTHAGREHTMVSAEALESQWRGALEIAADVVRNPVFPAADLERIRRQRLTDLARIADDPAAIAPRAARALLYGGESTYGHPAGGTEASVGSLSRNELAEHYAGRFGPTGATFVVAGQVKADEAVELVERHFGDWQPPHAPNTETSDGAISDPNPGHGGVIYLADKPGAAQSVIRSGQTLVGRLHSDFMPLVLFNLVFGGEFSARLNMNLRQDKGYSYGYMSSIDWLTGPSAMFAGGSVQTAVTKEAVVETLKEYSDIRSDRPVEEAEFNDAVAGLLRGFPSRFETHGQITGQLARLASLDLPDDYLVNYPDMVRGVSLKVVRRVAKQHVRETPDVLLVVGDRESVEPGLRELGLPIVLVDNDGRPL
jgi:zinc protease